MVDVNLLPWRAQIALAKERRMRRILLAIILAGILLFGIENATTFYLQQKMVAVRLQQIQQNESVSQTEITEVQLAEQITQQNNYFLLLWHKINFFANYHIQLLKLNYAEEKISLEGEVSSFNDLSSWIQAMHASGLHALVQRLNKSSLNQFHFLVSIQSES